MEYKGLIDRFKVSKAFRKEINECLIAMELSTIPDNIFFYPAVNMYLGGLKIELEKELERLKSEKSTIESEKSVNTKKSLEVLEVFIKITEREINRALGTINDKIEMIIRDIRGVKIIQWYHDTYDKILKLLLNSAALRIIEVLNEAPNKSKSFDELFNATGDLFLFDTLHTLYDVGFIQPLVNCGKYLISMDERGIAFIAFCEAYGKESNPPVIKAPPEPRIDKPRNRAERRKKGDK